MLLFFHSQKLFCSHFLFLSISYIHPLLSRNFSFFLATKIIKAGSVKRCVIQGSLCVVHNCYRFSLKKLNINDSFCNIRCSSAMNLWLLQKFQILSTLHFTPRKAILELTRQVRPRPLQAVPLMPPEVRSPSNLTFKHTGEMHSMTLLL